MRGRVRFDVRHWWPVLAAAAVVVACAGFAAVAWRAQIVAHELGARATREFPGDEVEALIRLIEAEDRPLVDRNRAVYALGQIGDARALPALEARFTGGECDHERFLCQQELRKAIRRCRGENWAPRWLPFLPQRGAGGR